MANSLRCRNRILVKPIQLKLESLQNETPVYFDNYTTSKKQN